MSSICNLTFLKSFTSNDPVKIKKYVGMFLDLAPKGLENMKNQCDVSDWKALRTSAHSLKSQYKYMGIVSAEELAVLIEKNAEEEKELEEMAAKIAGLSAITTEAMAELRLELNKL